MKKAILLITLLVISLSSFSQSQDLINLAKGEYKGFTVIYNQKKNVFGYLVLYSYGKSGKKSEKFEYHILDKNLNPMMSNQFDATLNGLELEKTVNFFLCKKSNEDELLVTLVYASYTTDEEPFNQKFLKINLKENKCSIVSRYRYKEDVGIIDVTNQTKEEIAKDEKEEKKAKDYQYNSLYYPTYYDGNFVEGFRVAKTHTFNGNTFYDKGSCDLIRLDKNKNFLWKYTYNNEKVKNREDEQSLKVIDLDDKNVFCILRTIENKESLSYLIVLDVHTGKEMHKAFIPDFSFRLINENSWYNNSEKFKENIANKIVFFGNYSKKGSSDDIGFIKFTIDKSNYKVVCNKILFEDLKKSIPEMTDEGKFNGRFLLKNKGVFLIMMVVWEHYLKNLKM